MVASRASHHGEPARGDPDDHFFGRCGGLGHQPARLVVGLDLCGRPHRQTHLDTLGVAGEAAEQCRGVRVVGEHDMFDLGLDEQCIHEAVPSASLDDHRFQVVDCLPERFNRQQAGRR